MIAFFCAALVMVGLWIGYQDSVHGKIPNLALLALAALFPLRLLLQDAPLALLLLSGLLGLCITVFLFFFYQYRSSVGAGDLKLFCLSCFFVPLDSLPFFIVSSGILGLILGLFYRIRLHKKAFPLGPVLMTALLGTLFHDLLL